MSEDEAQKIEDEVFVVKEIIPIVDSFLDVLIETDVEIQKFEQNGQLKMEKHF